MRSLFSYVHLFSARPALTSISFQAGLFSAVLTAFVVPKILDLKVNPADQSAYYQNQTAYTLGRISQQLASVDLQISSNYIPYKTFHASASDRRVNILWLISLVCSLSSALLATLVQQWARAYMRIFQQSRNPLRAARIRLFLFEGAKRLPSVAEFVPGLIHISLILFLWGLGDIIFHIDKTVFIAIVVPILLCVLPYLLCMFVPIWNPQSPYSTPFSPCIWYLIQILRNLYNSIRSGLVNLVQVLQVTSMDAHREDSAMEPCKNRDVRAVQWLANAINGNHEMQAFVLAISGSFKQEWGRSVWKEVVSDDLPTSSVGQPRGLLSIQKETGAIYRLCRCVRNFFEDEGGFMDSKVQRTRMRGCIETAASLVCCAGVELDSFGDVVEVLSEVGKNEQTNSLSIESNPLFAVHWTCLSLVAIKQIVNDEQLQQLADMALGGIALFQTDPASRDTVTKALTATQKMDNDLKKAWEDVLDLRLALEPWSQSQNTIETEIRSILNQDSHKASIQELERIGMEAVGLKDIDWRIRLLQNTMDEVTHELTRRLPGVFFDELRLSEGSDLPSVQTTPIPPQLIFPGQQLQSIYILGQRLRDITNTEWNEETHKSLKYLREVPIPLRGLNYLMERQLWRLLDLRDGGGLGFTIELFFLALRQLPSASPSPDKSPSSELEKAFYTGTFYVIKSNWKNSKNSVGTQRILLDLLCDLIIQGRGIFSDFRYPRYIVEMLLDLVGKMVEGLGRRGPLPHIDELLYDLTGESLRDRMHIRLRDEARNKILQSLNIVSSLPNTRISRTRESHLSSL
jgi:hypothetical protein